MKRYSLPIASMAAALLVLCGCTFHRTHTNEGVRDLDPSGLTIGQSTWRDCIRVLGLPAASTSERVGQELPTLRYFKYTFSDNKTTRLTITPIVFLPFEWVDEQSARQLVVEFDGNGVVKEIHSSDENAIWRPLQGESSRRSEHTTRSQEGKP